MLKIETEKYVPPAKNAMKASMDICTVLSIGIIKITKNLNDKGRVLYETGRAYLRLWSCLLV